MRNFITAVLLVPAILFMYVKLLVNNIASAMKIIVHMHALHKATFVSISNILVKFFNSISGWRPLEFFVEYFGYVANCEKCKLKKFLFLQLGTEA